MLRIAKYSCTLPLYEGSPASLAAAGFGGSPLQMVARGASEACLRVHGLPQPKATSAQGTTSAPDWRTKTRVRALPSLFEGIKLGLSISSCRHQGFYSSVIVGCVMFDDMLGASMSRGRALTNNSDVLAMFHLKYSG